MIAQIRSLKVLLLLVLAIALAGCGGGKSPLSEVFGTAAFTVSWSDTKGDPFAESATIVITQNGEPIASQTVDRYQGEPQTIVNFERLRTGASTAIVTVYPMAGGGGTPTGQASMPMTITGGANASYAFTTSTDDVTWLEMNPTNPEIGVGDSLQLVATPYNTDDEVVLVPVDGIEWTSSKTIIASVDTNGKVMGLAPGKSDITATETGTPKSVMVSIPVGYAEWTVLVYMAADNNLEEYAIMDVNEMESIGSDSKLKIAFQLDRTPGYDETNGNWTTARRYLATKDADVNIMNSQLIQELGEVDMAAPETLASFIQWGTEKYPAYHYLLVLWDHGRGWRSRILLAPLTREVKSINVDDTSGTEMSLEALALALNSNPGLDLDIVCFDACLMQMMEVAYAIRDYADIMVGSEENVPVVGLPYALLMSKISADPEISPYALSEGIVDVYLDYFDPIAGNYTMSALDLTQLDALVTASDEFAQAVLANLPAARTGVRSAQAQAQRYDYDKNDYRAYKDLYDFARLVNDLVPVTEVQTSAQSVMSAVDNVIIHERNSGEQMAGSHGVSIYLPDPGTSLSAYRVLDWSQDTHWDELVEGY